MDLACRLLALAAHPGIGSTTIRRMASQLDGWAHLAMATDERVMTLAQAMLGKRASISAASWAEAQRQAELTVAAVLAAKAQVLVPGMPSWPPKLERLAKDAPLWLFTRGDHQALLADGVAVIGSRHPTQFGLACARRFGQRVAESGLTVISGLANGCDAAAHAGCLDAGGRGVAVMPGPIDRVVPTSQRDLGDGLLGTGGCWCGEYAPDAGSDVPAYQFVARDRIQAGLARGILMVESGADGGTLHAVHAAQRMGIPIACLMRGDHTWLAQPVTQANQSLVRDGLATPLATAEDLKQWLARLSASPAI